MEMGIKTIPNEILGYILGALLQVDEDEDEGTPEIDLGNLRTARLVCRRWNAAASLHMFRTIALLHPGAGHTDFSNFANLTASETVRDAARCVEIYSGPHHFGKDMSNDRHEGLWGDWERGHYGEFVSAINCIARLPRLRAVHIRFSNKCGSKEDLSWLWNRSCELESTRMHTLRAVFGAIHARAARPGVTAITSLTIQNLQNIPISRLMAPDLFQAVAKDIAELRLRVVEEDGTLSDREERLIFEPWLQKKFLPVLADRLTSLQLEFDEYWGAAPGYFDGGGLLFPHLKTLVLGRFTIAHHDHLDWVLRQKSIETLRLRMCVIASHLAFSQVPGDLLKKWAVQQHDWHRLEEGAFGLQRMAVFTFPGTWEAVFDAIRTQLPNLVDFRTEHYSPSERCSSFNPGDDMACRLTWMRYAAFTVENFPLPMETWSNPWLGNLQFGNNNPAVAPLDQHAYDANRMLLNRAKDTFPGDRRGFEDLVRAVKDRRRKRGLDSTTYYTSVLVLGNKLQEVEKKHQEEVKKHGRIVDKTLRKLLGDLF